MFGKHPYWDNVRDRQSIQVQNENKELDREYVSRRRARFGVYDPRLGLASAKTLEFMKL